MKSSQSGNVLFLILIAVVLFAALSYVVTQSTRSGSADTSSEQTRLRAAEILNYATSIRAAYTRVSAFCDYSQISFYFPETTKAEYNNPRAPSNGKCHIFNPNGAGASKPYVDTKWFATYPNEYSDEGMWIFYNAFGIDRTGGFIYPGHTGSPAGPATLLPRVTRDICLEINKKLGIDDPLTSVANNGAQGAPLVNVGRYVGIKNYYGFTINTDNRTAYRGRFTGCYYVTPQPEGAAYGDMYVFYDLISPF